MQQTLCLKGGFTYVTNIVFKMDGLHMYKNSMSKEKITHVTKHYV